MFLPSEFLSILTPMTGTAKPKSRDHLKGRSRGNGGRRKERIKGEKVFILHAKVSQN